MYCYIIFPLIRQRKIHLERVNRLNTDRRSAPRHISRGNISSFQTLASRNVGYSLCALFLAALPAIKSCFYSLAARISHLPPSIRPNSSWRRTEMATERATKHFCRASLFLFFSCSFQFFVSVIHSVAKADKVSLLSRKYQNTCWFHAKCNDQCKLM